MGGINWTRWERIKNFVIQFDNAAQPDSITNLYKYTPQLSLKTGIAYDKSPVTNAQDKHLSFDFGYSHLFIDDIEIDSSEAYSTEGYTAGYHRLTGKYSAQVDILSLQLNWIF
jgi:long-subunit fatty acid transport protein